MKNGHLKILLAGNPNSGKTTIFNELSGMRAKVGNYAGVTVEKKSKTCRASIRYRPPQPRKKSPPTRFRRGTSTLS